MPFATDVPTFWCYLRREYLYDMESHHGELEPVQVIGADSVSAAAVGFDVMTEWGALIARLPVSALCHKENAPSLPLDWLQLWSCFGYDMEVHEYASLRNLACDVLLRDKQWYRGRYMFTFSWKKDPLADNPGEGGFKRGHMVKLDNGCYCVQPNNRIRWFEPSWITKPFPERPDIQTNSHVWLCESATKWATSDDYRYFYEVEDAERDGNSGPEDGSEDL